jgi:hypothetical protein
MVPWQYMAVNSGPWDKRAKEPNGQSGGWRLSKIVYALMFISKDG